MPLTQAILIATGDDRPGVLDDVSLFLTERHAAILESRVSLLRGQFGLLLLIRADDNAIRSIKEALPKLDDQAGIHTELRNASEDASADVIPQRLIASGKDSAVAMHRLSHLLRVLGVNILNVETDVQDQMGQPRFTLDMELSVPRSTPLMMLKQYLQGLSDEIGIQCELKSL